MKQIVLVITLICFSGALVFGQAKENPPVKKAKKSKIDKRFIKPPGVSPGNGYSHAISVSGGRTIYVAGQVALNEKGELVGRDDLRAQTQQVFENIKTVLAASGATFADVVKISYFIKDFKSEMLPAIREVRNGFLPAGPPPTSTLVGVESLFRPDILIEIECIAVVE